MRKFERAAWATALLGVIAWSAMDRKTPDSLPGGEASTEARTGGSRDRWAGTGDGGSPDRRSARQGADRPGFESQSRTALRGDDPLQRMSDFLSLVSTCDADGLDALESSFAALKAEGVSLPAEEALLNFRAGQLKGAALLGGRSGTAEDFAMLDTLKPQFEGWIQGDPHSAGKWVEGLAAGKFRDRMAISYIAAVMKDDPAQSMRWVASLHPSQQATAGKVAADKLTETGSLEEAGDLLRTLGASGGSADDAYLRSMFESLVDKATGDNRQVAIALVESHLDQPYVTVGALTRATSEKAKDDPIAALQWAADIEYSKPGVPQGGMIAAAIGGMSAEGLSAAEKWAEIQPDADLWLQSIGRRKNLLEDRGTADHNEYDKGD